VVGDTPLGIAPSSDYPDGTLGAENSVVTPLNPLVNRIDGGAIQS